MFTVRYRRTSFHVRGVANHIKTSMLVVERTGMLYILKLVFLQWKERVCCTFGITKFVF